ncbi:S41 family peptidase [Flavobacterium saccharophilum]|uniref:Tetratricopeptide repeat-containing protein n=1 Tax=Flavobacterium saccharophilum TaxID=29534 RepID=A0A1M7D3D4_9FLAO|nr:S41 family peptidase [Flavobacterium saccharophilum]SHL73903.1 Tetratricopeptide repeat-containing protein [Flavobacterium saccharophilum]
MKNYFKMILLTLFLIVQNAMAQDSKRLLDTKEKKAIVSAIKTHIEKSYIDLDLSKRMTIELDNNLKSNKYKEITSPVEFSKILTEDLQRISKDLHLKVRFEPEHIAREKNVISQEAQLEMEKRMAFQMAEINYGFKEVKILDGNIGYLNLNQFADIKYAEETVTATMNFLSNTNAIIIDLRANGGGVPSMMQLLSSYFFDEKPVLLSDFYERETNQKTQLYSFENVNGKRSTNKPLYILTSKHTFSAAEAFTYTLKHLDRATVVGEITKGGANRTKRINLNTEFTISVPYLQPINPVTKTNWETKGIQPDIVTSGKEAFVYAYIDAIKKTIKKNKSNVLNKIGYAFLQDKQGDNAVIVFQENVKLFPNDSNSWDSLGEAYFANQDKENALKSYKKALELDSGSESAKAMIQKVESMK